MYFNRSNRFYHGIMFHHFHDNKIHSKGQGSISRDQLLKIIKLLEGKIYLTLMFFKKN